MMPRTLARLERLGLYALDRWEQSGLQCDLWWNGWYLAWLYHATPEDARRVIQDILLPENVDGEQE